MRSNQFYLEKEDEYPQSNMEITDKSLTQANNSLGLNSRLSKRISGLESRSHRNKGRFNRGITIAPKSCQLNCDRESSTAFIILQYQLKDRQTQEAHINNLKLNLERRLQSAKAQGNQELITILDREFEQLIAL